MNRCQVDDYIFNTIIIYKITLSLLLFIIITIHPYIIFFKSLLLFKIIYTHISYFNLKYF